MGATAVGAPAKIIGFIPRGERPGSTVNQTLEGVEPLLGKNSPADSSLSSSITENTPGGSSVSIAAEVTKATEGPMEEEEKKRVAVAEEGDTVASTSNEEDEEGGKSEKGRG